MHSCSVARDLIAFGYELLLVWLSLVALGFREYPRRFAWGLAFVLTAIAIPLLGGYGWLAVLLLSLANEWRSGWADQLAAWDYPLPVPSLSASVTETIKYSVHMTLLVGVMVAGTALIALMSIAMFQAWKRSIRLLGSSAALRSAGTMCRILYRQPLRYLYFTAPGFLPLVLLMLLMLLMLFLPSWFALPDGQDFNSMLMMAIAVLVILFALVVSAVSTTPPVVAWLSVSGFEEFRTLKNVQKICPLQLKTLIDQASEEIEPRYWHYYSRRTESHRNSSKGMQRLWGHIALAFLNTRGLRAESVRTRPGLWQRTVHDLADIAPIVVVDTRRVSGPVMEQILWMLAPDRVHKSIFVVGDQCRGSNLDEAVRKAGITDRSAILACNEKMLYDLLSDMTQSPLDLPRRGDDRWRKKVNETRSELDRLMDMIRADSVTAAELDDGTRTWEQACARDTHTAGNDAPYSTSFDAALALIKRRFPKASVSLFVYTSGAAELEIGVPDRGGDWMIYSSKETPRLRLGTARAALLAWTKAEQGSRKEQEVPTETDQKDDEARWRERSIQQSVEGQ